MAKERELRAAVTESPVDKLHLSTRLLLEDLERRKAGSLERARFLLDPRKSHSYLDLSGGQRPAKKRKYAHISDGKIEKRAEKGLALVKGSLKNATIGFDSASYKPGGYTFERAFEPFKGFRIHTPLPRYAKGKEVLLQPLFLIDHIARQSALTQSERLKAFAAAMGYTQTVWEDTVELKGHTKSKQLAVMSDHLLTYGMEVFRNHGHDKTAQDVINSSPVVVYHK